MSVLNVENVSHGFGGRRILEDVSFRLLKGEHVALIGANGEGKSTFLDIVTGVLMPDAGIVEWSKRVTVGYLDQRAKLEAGRTIRDCLRDAFGKMFALELEMLNLYEQMASVSGERLDEMLADVGDIQHELEHNGFYMIDAKIEEVAFGLGLGEIGLDRDVNELSGGQRTKVLLTKLLLESPSILVLDEPTNYLDLEHIEWLKRYLKDYANSFILVSHNLPFVNAVTNVIYHVENTTLTRYTGNYDQFQEMLSIKRRQDKNAYERQQKEIDQLEDFIARNKARVSTTGRAKSRQKQLDKMDVLEKPREKLKPTFKFKNARAAGKIVVEVKDLILGYNEPLTKPISLKLERGQRVAIRGVNGLGKTTLLRTMMGEIPPYKGNVCLGDYLFTGYFQQESSRDNNNTALEDVWKEYPGLSNFEARQALARCGLTNEHITNKVKVLSGGEAAKVRLCKLMLKDINWLLLDEPTNHLDQDAKQELRKALQEFKGTILLVSHEPEFYQDWVTDVWNLEEWTTKLA